MKIMKQITDEEISSLSFEDAMTRLEESVRSLEQGNLSLEESVAVFEFGNKLKNHCDQKLKEAKLMIEKVIKTSKDSVARVEPVDS
ncbi:MAG: exodeoxyribonuclease VII small subunit [Holosporales bacterium]|jgi:exodeoxyribonuclease VII small subunit|nr:exodeoxyribonuclease VII small subunit [Holosporales bacterium]